MPLQWLPLSTKAARMAANKTLHLVYNKSRKKEIRISVFTIISTDYFDRP